MPALTDEERRDWRARIRAAETDEERAALRADRATLRRLRRDEQREKGKAWDQVLARLVADVVDEEEARDLVGDMAPELRDLVLAGRLDDAVDTVLEEFAEAGDDLLDFRVVPVVGPWIELVDGHLIRACSDALRPWVRSLILDVVGR